MKNSKITCHHFSGEVTEYYDEGYKEEGKRKMP